MIDRDILVANVIGLVRRLLTTPADQPGLLDDRINDLAIALWELDNIPQMDAPPGGFKFIVTMGEDGDFDVQDVPHG